MEGNAASDKAQRRLKKLRAEQQEQLDGIKRAKKQARGAGSVKRKALAKVLAEALAEQALIDAELEDIVTALPGLVEDEGKNAAAARIATIAQQAPAQVSKLLKAQKAELAASVELIRLIAIAGAVRVGLMRGQQEIRVLRARWPQLQHPPVPEIRELQDVAPGILKVIRLTPLGPKPFRASHRASADVEERKRETWRALSKWLEKHGKSLTEETRQIFQHAGVPVGDPEETPEHRQRREEREARAKEAEEEFTQRSSAEGARVHREGVLR